MGESALPERALSGALMRVKSRDVYSAVAGAGAIADGFASRVAVGTHKDFAPLAKAFVKGCRAPVDLRPSRRVDVLSLDRQGRLYVGQQSSSYFEDRAIRATSWPPIV